MNELKYVQDLYNLELNLDSDFNIYEINLWLSDGMKTRIAFWERKGTDMCLVLVGNTPFSEMVNKDLFWQIAEEGQSILEVFFWTEDGSDGEI